MKIEIKYNGETYVTKETEEGGTAEEVAEQVYSVFDDVSKLKWELEDGSFLVMGKRAAQSAVLRFIP